MSKVSKRFHLPKHIQNLQPYRPGKPIRDAALEFGLSKWIKLASNENPLGISPKASAAVIEALKEGHFYPHPRSPELISAISKKFGKKEEEIVCANGIDALLSYILMAFTYEGDEVLTSQGTFIGLNVNVQKLGRILQTVPLKDYHFDLDALAAAITPSTKLIYLSNPNNPTGTAFSKTELDRFLTKVPHHIIVVLDEAYYEYACHDSEYPNGLEYDLDRMIVARTFSKAYGLAGLRVGYAFTNALWVAEIQKVKLPFEPASISSLAAAAALSDSEFLKKTQALNLEGMKYLSREFDRLGINYVKPSSANFYMLLFDDVVDAGAFVERCMSLGLILRPLGSFGIPHGVRINTGTMEENRSAIQIIEKTFKGRSS